MQNCLFSPFSIPQSLQQFRRSPRVRDGRIQYLDMGTPRRPTASVLIIGLNHLKYTLVLAEPAHFTY